MKDEVILCFGYTTWDFWRTDQEIMIRLSKNNKVIYVEKQLSYLSSDRKGTKERNFWKKVIGEISAKEINENFLVITPPARLPRSLPSLPKIVKNRLFYRSIIISKKILEIIIKRMLKEIKLKPTIFWCFEPFDLCLAGRFDERISCYSVYDELGMFKGFSTFQKQVEDFEKRFINNADFVFASSRFQYKKRKKLNSNTYFIPNACDFYRYNKVLTESLSIPDDIKEIPSPIIGFIGKVNYKIDEELISLLSKIHPEWSIVFVGPEEKDTVNILQNNTGRNVFFLGHKKVEKLPNYLKYFDVSIIPYKVNELTKSMHLWKIYEHLAAGEPIVCTNLPEARPFEDVVRIAKTRDEFLRYVEKALISNSEEKIKRRVEIAKRNTWENRIREIERIIENGK